MATPAANRTTLVRDRNRIYRLTSAKRNALDALAEYFCLRVYDLAKLLRRREPTESDLRTERRTLGLLYREGKVNRLPYFDLQTEGVSYVYGLTDKTAKECGGKTFDEHSQRTLDHELEITFFHMNLKAFAERHGLKLYWQQQDLKTKTIHPDAYFALTDPTKPKDKNTNHFFLEIERSKIGHYWNGEPSIFRKLRKYYDLFDTIRCEEDWRFRHFRVIVAQCTEERCKNLCRTFQDKYRHRMFWLTAGSLYKRDFLGRIFLTPKDAQGSSCSLADIF